MTAPELSYSGQGSLLLCKTSKSNAVFTQEPAVRQSTTFTPGFCMRTKAGMALSLVNASN